MACTSPLKAFMVKGNDGRNQKPVFYKPERFGFISYEDLPDDNKVLIPCGQCDSCRLSYAQQWATRCMLEASQYEFNFFVTLTYNEDHLPVSEYPVIDYDSGEFLYFSYSSSLVPRDLQLFMKRLRIKFQRDFGFVGLRFYACGEYGSKNMRPHYHLILFNCPLADLKYECSNFNGDAYYTSDFINSCWTDDNGLSKGFVTVAECNYSTCCYVARYMLKKQKGEDALFYERNGLVPPFTRSSNKPGIGKAYFDKNFDKIYSRDYIIIPGADGIAKKVMPPKYFDKLYDVFAPADLQAIKDERKRKAEISKIQTLENTSKSWDEYLTVQADYVKERANKLLRNL